MFELITLQFFGKCIAFILGVVFLVVLYKNHQKAQKILIKNHVLLNDIRFMLSVEDLHCRANTEDHGKSGRTSIRNSVKFERGLEWSGKYTNSTISRELEKNKALNAALITPVDNFTKGTAISIVK